MFIFCFVSLRCELTVSSTYRGETFPIIASGKRSFDIQRSRALVRGWSNEIHRIPSAQHSKLSVQARDPRRQSFYPTRLHGVAMRRNVSIFPYHSCFFRSPASFPLPLNPNVILRSPFPLPRSILAESISSKSGSRRHFVLPIFARRFDEFSNCSISNQSALIAPTVIQIDDFITSNGFEARDTTCRAPIK